MTCTANNSINRHWGSGKPFALALLLSCLALVSVNAAPQPTGVRNSQGSERLNEKQLRQVQESLRHKSGFMELGFDAQGVLLLGNHRHITCLIRRCGNRSQR